MNVLKGVEKFSRYLEKHDCRTGCFADTGFLYAVSYQDDRLHDIASQVHDVLAECKIPIHTNVISRMEFVDLIFRKQVTLGAIQLFDSVNAGSIPKSLFNTLKDIRDKDTASKKEKKSYKVDEFRLKKIRKELEQALDVMSWREFCKTFVGKMLVSEWTLLEQELGLNFIEVMEGGVSDEITSPLLWEDMVEVMGEYGLRGPDAMIVNLFSKSDFPVLITADRDFESCLSDPLISASDKTIFLLE